jgi:zinc transporter ZupT
VSLAGAHKRSRVAVPFAAGVLIGVALFFLLPELIAETGWAPALLLFGAGYFLLFAVNRYVYPVCPTCTHDHDHKACDTVLHGFAAPLITASAMHSLLDGWSIATAGEAVEAGIRLAVPLAIAAHKVPEGVALGGILRASVKSRWPAFGWCTAAQACTLAGGALGLALAPGLGSHWVGYPLAIAGGSFFYLGFHAVHEEWKRRGAVPAFAPALTGGVLAAVLQRGFHALSGM